MTCDPKQDLDFLAARLHARRSRMAEGRRLDEWCTITSLPGLNRAVYSDEVASSAWSFQRRLLHALLREMTGCLGWLDTAGSRLVDGLRARFLMENLKILLRGFLSRIPLEDLQPHLIELPPDLAPDASAMMAAKSLAGFMAGMPAGRPGGRLRAVAANHDGPPPGFLLEAALDAGYFEEMFHRTDPLPAGEREVIRPMISQEADLFQFQLAVRGRFHLGFPAEALLPLRVTGSGAGPGWFTALLAAPDISAAAKLAAAVITDALAPLDSSSGTGPALAGIEALAWQRYYRLANGAFRRSHLGLGAVAGYFGVRRVEIANLITLSEGIRLGLGAEEIRGRMMPRNSLEVAHV